MLLPGGQGETWRAGDVILKPCAATVEAAWVAEVMSGLQPSDEFRVPTPLPAADGSWTAYGWQAWRAVDGEADPRRCDDVLRAGQAFHRALAGLPRPEFLDVRDDPWSFGDRLAFHELPMTGHEVMSDLLTPLVHARRPVTMTSQVVHGDLLGNVLFADGLPPAIIDWPVYFRPAPWALAVAVIDAVAWHSATDALVNRWAATDQWDQMLVRALIFRIATSEGRRRHGLDVREAADGYRPVVDLVLTRIADGTFSA